MPVEFTEDEKGALVDLLVGIIERDPFPLSARIQRLRGILAKLRPRSCRATKKRRWMGDRTMKMAPSELGRALCRTEGMPPGVDI